MELVVDTSVIIAVIADEPAKPKLISLTQSADLIAPRSVHWEIGNAFSAMLKRHRITLEQALHAIDLYYAIPVRFVDVELEAALAIAESYTMIAYDAYLIRCAQRYDAPLLSLDRELVRLAAQAGVQVLEVH
jgi:predicted nucleic acid-binding protein